MEPNLLSRRSFLALTTMAAAGMTLKPASGESQDLAYLTLKEASELVRRSTVSPVDLIAACLKHIEAYNPALNAFITVTRDQAMETARAMEEEQRRGKWRGPLHGIPVALKDNIDTAGVRTTAASELFKDRVPSEDAEVVRRLKNAGAVLLGKTNLHEFALGGTSAVSYFGPVHNPWALDLIPGGSSGGSAPPQPPVCASDRWEPTPPDQFEFPLATAASSGSGLRTAASAAAERCRTHGPWTKLVLCAGALRTRP